LADISPRHSRGYLSQRSESISYTRTAVRECCTGNEASQWKRPKFDP